MEDECSQSIEVTVQAPGWNATVTDIEPLCHEVVAAALRDIEPETRERLEVSLLLTDDATIRGLNARWRGKDRPTNVLSFPAMGLEDAGEVGPVLLGDVVVALETTCAEASDEGLAVEAHLAHLVVHGVLHLRGHDHENDDEATIMEARESRILKELGFPDPHAPRALLEAFEGAPS